MAFIRTKEPFTCEYCGVEVFGDGYTNHCPACLWSKHVDIDPGDRRATCGGMMEPIGAGAIHGEQFILHTCVLCGYSKRNKVAKNDSMDVYVRIPGIV